MMDSEKKLFLGKQTVYPSKYEPDLLRAFPRQNKRDVIGITGALPFAGYDIWNAYELSWLNGKGKPVVAMGEFQLPCSSPCLIESKSFKLYLNSFNQSCFATAEQVESRLVDDLSRAAGERVRMRLLESDQFVTEQIQILPGDCLDEQDLEIHQY